jgi:hypothetical protein
MGDLIALRPNLAATLLADLHHGLPAMMGAPMPPGKGEYINPTGSLDFGLRDGSTWVPGYIAPRAGLHLTLRILAAVMMAASVRRSRRTGTLLSSQVLPTGRSD